MGAASGSECDRILAEVGERSRTDTPLSERVALMDRQSQFLSQIPARHYVETMLAEAA